MFDGLLELLSKLPNELYVFIISMLPIVELRGAVPIGAVLDIPFYLNFLIAVVGNMLPIPLILLFIPKILDFLERFKFFKPIVRWLKGKADKHSAKVLVDEPKKDDAALETEKEEREGGAGSLEEETKKALMGGERKMSGAVFTALMLFVALPIPGTGAWSGSLVASLFNLPKKKSLLAIFIGVIICGTIMTLASYGVLGFLSFLT